MGRTFSNRRTLHKPMQDEEDKGGIGGTNFTNTGEMSTGTTEHKTGNNGVFMLRPSSSGGATMAGMTMMNARCPALLPLFYADLRLPRPYPYLSLQSPLIIRPYMHPSLCTNIPSHPCLSILVSIHTPPLPQPYTSLAKHLPICAHPKLYPFSPIPIPTCSPPYLYPSVSVSFPTCTPPYV